MEPSINQPPSSPEERDEEVRYRAYMLWLEEGQPEGRADDHWHQAHAATAASETDAVAALNVPKKKGR